MMQQLWVMAHFLALALSVAVGSHLPLAPVQLLVLVLAGAVLLAPVVSRLAYILTRALSLVPHGPPVRLRLARVPVGQAVGAPGTPGAALARAPSLVVGAFA